MKCKDIIRELSDYLDGELDQKLVAEVQRHMEHCEDCRVVVDTTRKTIRLFCNSEPAELPSEVHDRLHRALERRLRTTPPS
ncbi:MAG: zf-HC2 domain-containing protein [Acidobacteria bacterium]|nr:zf-HC2 domain-containing protein [Acidobacteriota bacterium]